MREIKFRAWDKVSRTMRSFQGHKDGILYAYGYFQVSSGYDSYDNPTFDEDTSDRFEIMQYTGLKEGAGNEIFEGDILKFKWLTQAPENPVGVGWYFGMVVSENAKFRVRFDIWSFDAGDINQSSHDRLWREDYGSGSSDFYKMTGFEVAGNIYENPELLS